MKTMKELHQNTFLTNSSEVYFLQFQYECCGVEDFLDFKDALKWDRVRNTKYRNDTLLVTPITCCKTDGKFPNGVPIDETCAYAPTESNSNWEVVSLVDLRLHNITFIFCF